MVRGWEESVKEWGSMGAIIIACLDGWISLEGKEGAYYSSFLE